MGGDPSADSPVEMTAQVRRAFNRNLPNLLAGINSSILPNELAKLSVAQLVTPALTNLANQTNASTRISNEAVDLGLLDTAGRERARIATEIDKGINPEFYTGRAGILQALLGQLSNLDLSKPNVEAERLINAENVRSGNAGAPSKGTTGVANALQFESEKLKRSNALSQALTTANQFLTSGRASFDPFGRSTVSDGINVEGTPNTNSLFQNVGDDAMGISEGILNNIFGQATTQANINANRRDSLDRVNETMSSLPSYT